MREPATGEYAGPYPWKSKGDLEAYRDSELRATIANARRTGSEPRVEVYAVLKALREQAPRGRTEARSP